MSSFRRSSSMIDDANAFQSVVAHIKSELRKYQDLNNTNTSMFVRSLTCMRADDIISYSIKDHDYKQKARILDRMAELSAEILRGFEFTFGPTPSANLQQMYLELANLSELVMVPELLRFVKSHPIPAGIPPQVDFTRVNRENADQYIRFFVEHEGLGDDIKERVYKLFPPSQNNRNIFVPTSTEPVSYPKISADV